ncbi:MAG: glycosyl transferase family 1 [Anaerolineae bacterium SM23_84]|nr:MAG: glycosyl transferase family 1 [Anaerolineae bacterium SM23_84]
MRILHIYKDYYPIVGGMENHIKMLSEALVQRGHQVTVLVTHPTSRTHIEEINGVYVIKAGRLATVASAPLSLALPIILRRQRPDIAHLHFPYPIGEVSQLLFGRASRTIITYHSDVVRQKGLLKLYRPLLWKALHKADGIIATSPKYIDTSPYLSRVREKCTVIPLGLELQRFLHVSESQVEPIQEAYGSPLLLFVGRLRYYKGLEYLLAAMSEIPCKLLIVGSGPMEDEWRQLAESLRLSDKVVFLGQVTDDDLPPYYHASDIFVLPASERSEAFGTVQVEAMASGLPVVCTELGTGTSFVNVHGQTGLVVPPADPPALAAAILKLLASEDLRRTMGRRGRERASREFSAQTMVDRTITLYEKVLNT